MQRRDTSATRIGDLLLKRGTITSRQLAFAIEEQRRRRLSITDATAADRVRTALGEILVDLGFVERKQLLRCLTWQKRLRRATFALAFVTPLLSVAAPASAASEHRTHKYFKTHKTSFDTTESSYDPNETTSTTSGTTLYSDYDPNEAEPTITETTAYSDYDPNEAEPTTITGTTTYSNYDPNEAEPTTITGTTTYSNYDPNEAEPTTTETIIYSDYDPNEAEPTTTETITYTDYDPNEIDPNEIAALGPPPLPTVALSWQIPELRQSGDALSLSEIGGYEIIYQKAGDPLSYSIIIDDPTISTYVIENLEAGDYEFMVAAFDTEGLYSEYSPPVQKTLQ